MYRLGVVRKIQRYSIDRKREKAIGGCQGRHSHIPEASVPSDVVMATESVVPVIRSVVTASAREEELAHTHTHTLTHTHTHTHTVRIQERESIQHKYTYSGLSLSQVCF